MWIWGESVPGQCKWSTVDVCIQGKTKATAAGMERMSGVLGGVRECTGIYHIGPSRVYHTVLFDHLKYSTLLLWVSTLP